MAKTSKKKRAYKPAPASNAYSTEQSSGRKLATVIVSVVLIIGLGLPVAGLGFASCSSCSMLMSD